MYSTSQTPSLYSYSSHTYIYSSPSPNTSLSCLLPKSSSPPSSSSSPSSSPTRYSSHPAPLTSHPTSHYRTYSVVLGQKRYSGGLTKQLSLGGNGRGREKEGMREMEPRRSFGIGGAGNIRAFSLFFFISSFTRQTLS
jgi:hypothetical protein